MVLLAGLSCLLIVAVSRAEGPVRPANDRVQADQGPVAVPAPSPKAIEFYETGVRLWFVGRIWGLAVPALFLFTGLSGRIRRFAFAKGRPWLVEVAIYAVIFLSLEFLLNLPLRYYSGFVRLHEYGLSVQSFRRWLGDGLKGLGVEIVGASLFLWVPYLLMARSPRRWWLYTGLLVLPFAGFSALIAPIVVDPLFNEFGPMKDTRLEARIDALAHRAGIDGSKIFEVDKSRDTTTVNAYVTGLFGTKRIVLWDTLLAKLEPEEVLVVMGHEMGHYVLNHVAQGLLLSSVGTIFALFLIHRVANAMIARFGRRFGFDRISDVASVPLILLLAQVTMLIGSPVIQRSQPAHGTRGRPFRPGDHPGQSRRGPRVREAPGRQSRGPLPRLAVQNLAIDPPADRRADRVLQQLSSLGGRPAAPGTAPTSESRSINQLGLSRRAGQALGPSGVETTHPGIC